MTNTIGHACNITTGKLDANQAVTGGEYPFFTCAEHPDQIDHFAFEDDVVLVAGNNARGNFHVSRFKGKFNAYQRTYVLSAKDGYDIDYIYYALKLELKRLREKSQGSQTKFLTKPILEGILLQEITHDNQTAIASVLATIDKKIELNNRINAELEAMAKTLYDYWFVQFDFPDANGKPYKTSGGKMVYNETLKREIPEGWEAAELGEHIKFERGISYRSNEILNNGVPMINLNSFDLQGRHKISGLKHYSGKYAGTKVVLSGDLVIAITDVTRNADIIGKAHTIPDLFDGDILLSCDVAKVVPSEKLDKYFLEYLFNSSSYHKYIKHFATGTLVLHLNLNGVNWCKIALPPKTLLDQFNSIRESHVKKQVLNAKENSKLETLRDWLLPMLMNGQVTVK